MVTLMLCPFLVVAIMGPAHAATAEASASLTKPVDLFPHKACLRYARCFSIEYHGTYKRLEVLLPGSTAKETFVFILAARGHTPPAHVTKGAMVIPIPIERIAVYSSIWLAFFQMLHVEQTLVGIAGCDWVSTPEIVSLIRQGHIVDIGDGRRGMNRQIDMERLTVLKPEAVMVYATGVPEFDQAPKLLEAGFKPVIDACHMEATPLGRTEWIKFVAAFFNKEEDAERLFDDIALRYQTMSEKARNVKRRPTIFCGVAWRGTWYTPGGASYFAQLLADAGAEYVWKNDATAGSMPLAIEAVFDRAKNADFWVDTKICGSLQELLAVDERYSRFAAFRAGKVFNNDAKLTAQGGNDYWETGVARPDLILGDLISIFHPELVPDHKLIWFRQLPSRTGERP